jgi:uncharacterized protein
MKELLQIDAGASSVPLEEKERHLFALLASVPSLLVALSGGTDSAYLAWAAQRALGKKALAITAVSPSFSAYDRAQTESFIASTGIAHEFIFTHEIDNPDYRENRSNRCYFCKDELFSAMNEIARAREFAAVCYGVNADDSLDFRPGHGAANRHQVLAPLLHAGLRKSEIRELARRAGLAVWNRPASACLASRIPYGTEVTPERLALIERGEAALRDLGFQQFRVRLHDNVARIEIAPAEMPRALEASAAAAIARTLKAAGFRYVALDLEGYRQGSLNESLP